MAEEYKVVVNNELQYSIWPTWKADPPGWTNEGTKGTKEECLTHIDSIWTDMRPLSLRKWMEENSQPEKPKIEIPNIPSDGVDHFHGLSSRSSFLLSYLFHLAAQPPNDLVTRLMKPQPIQVIRYCDRASSKPIPEQLLKAAETGYLLIKFTETKVTLPFFFILIFG